MKKWMWILAAMAVAALAAGGAGLLVAGTEQARNDVLYTCGCGGSCTCAKPSLTAGKCGCGKPLVWGHVVRVEGNDAFICSCKENCACKADEKDPKKFTCGHDLKRVSLVGTGIYFCNCAGSCTCNHLSDMPGKCHCGMTLHLAQLEEAAPKK